MAKWDADWDHGYVTDVVYTSNFYRETTPSWLATSALLLGHRPPDLSRPFRYADLGCGHGFTALTVAATSPQAEVWGFDFNPAHIEWARGMAEQAGLANARFVETSFADLAALPEAALPQFDFIVSHGVLSWISAANRQALMRVIRQRLCPGGLAYLSYNVTTGWSAMPPLRMLMHMLAEANPARTDQAVPEVLDTIDRIRESGALFFQANPALENRLKDIRQHDPRYIAHEYLNRDWHPLMFAEVARDMAEARCSFIGSATLTENIDAASVPPGMAQMITEARDPVFRETLRDFASAQGFRRDIYRRGITTVPSGEQQALIDALAVTATGVAAPDPVTFATSIGTVTGRTEIYRPIISRLEQGPASVRQLREITPFADRPLLELLQAVTLLFAGGYAHPALPGGNSRQVESARGMNLAIAALNAQGGDLPRLVAPAIGSVLQADVVETLLVGALLAGRPADPESLLPELQAGLAHGGRTIQRDGKPVTDPVEAKRMAGELVRTFLERRVPLLRRLGVLDG